MFHSISSSSLISDSCQIILGNAFLLECDRAGANVKAVGNGKYGSAAATVFKYPSYVQDIMGYTSFSMWWPSDGCALTAFF